MTNISMPPTYLTLQGWSRCGPRCPLQPSHHVYREWLRSFCAFQWVPTSPSLFAAVPHSACSAARLYDSAVCSDKTQDVPPHGHILVHYLLVQGALSSSYEVYLRFPPRPLWYSPWLRILPWSQMDDLGYGTSQLRRRTNLLADDTHPRAPPEPLMCSLVQRSHLLIKNCVFGAAVSVSLHSNFRPPSEVTQSLRNCLLRYSNSAGEESSGGKPFDVSKPSVRALPRWFPLPSRTTLHPHPRTPIIVHGISFYHSQKEFDGPRSTAAYSSN
jgi:hypothetical protein